MEPTTPQPGVAPAPSVENRLSAFLSQPEEPAAPEPDATPEPEPAAPAPAEATPPSDELTPEDLPDDALPTPAPNVGDEFEIVHNGTQHKLPRAEVIKLAQQGFDYTQKTQALSERSKALDGTLQRAAELEQMMPIIANEQAQIAAFKAQLAPYEKVDWVQLATDNPLDYPRHRAQYDLLVNGHNLAAQRAQVVMDQYKQHKQLIDAQRLQEEATLLPTYVPEWADQKRYLSDSDEALKWVASYGVDMNVVRGKLNDAFSCAVLYKAMKYDKLLKSKGDKAKLLQTAPPVARPGVHPSREAARTDKEVAAQNKFKKTGDLRDGAALLAMRLKL
jgi:hypothetical protein